MNNDNFIKSRYYHVNSKDILWQPDQSLPYMIHCAGHPLDGIVLIWPEVLRFVNKQGEERDYFFYMTNREHIFGGLMKRKKSAFFHHLPEENRTSQAITFTQEDGYGSHADLVIAPLTEEEFDIIRQLYKRLYHMDLNTREDLVKNYIDCIEP